MGADLYRSEPVYRQAVDECLALLAKRGGADYRSLLFPPAGQEAEAARRLEQPSRALPLLLTTQYALARLWMSWGLTPSAMIGHSMGEYTAAHLAGVFSLDDALTLHAALGDMPLDFLVLFSSISSFAGLAGQFDYAAANAFLDAFAQERTVTDGRYTVAINWSQWQEVGMAAELARRLGIGTSEGASEAAQEGGVPVDHPLLDRCLLDTGDERVYSTRFAVDRHWLLDEHRIRGGQALIPGTGYLWRASARSCRSPRSTGPRSRWWPVRCRPSRRCNRLCRPKRSKPPGSASTWRLTRPCSIPSSRSSARSSAGWQ